MSAFSKGGGKSIGGGCWPRARPIGSTASTFVTDTDRTKRQQSTLTDANLSLVGKSNASLQDTNDDMSIASYSSIESFQSTFHSTNRTKRQQSALTAANLSQLGNSNATLRGNFDEDDVMSVTSYSSIASFQSTYHSRHRCYERDVKRHEIGVAIKHGQLIKNAEDENSSMIVHNDLVVIVASSGKRMLDMRDATEDIIEKQISIKDYQGPLVAVTVWRMKNTYPLQSAEEYEMRDTINDLLTDAWAASVCYHTKNWVTARIKVQNRMLKTLQEAESKFGRDRLAAILNFLGVTPSLQVIDIPSLHYAVWNGYTRIVKEMLRIGADLNLRSNSKKQYPPVFYAVSSYVPFVVRQNPDIRKEIVELFLNHESPPEINTVVKRDTTLLHKAVYIEHQQLAQLLLDRGADPDIKSTYGETPRQMAIEKGLELNYREN
jgi:hypothetical protein